MPHMSHITRTKQFEEAKQFVDGQVGRLKEEIIEKSVDCIISEHIRERYIDLLLGETPKKITRFYVLIDLDVLHTKIANIVGTLRDTVVISKKLRVDSEYINAVISELKSLEYDVFTIGVYNTIIVSLSAEFTVKLNLSIELAKKLNSDSTDYYSKESSRIANVPYWKRLLANFLCFFCYVRPYADELRARKYNPNMTSDEQSDLSQIAGICDTCGGLWGNCEFDMIANANIKQV